MPFGARRVEVAGGVRSSHWVLRCGHAQSLAGVRVIGWVRLVPTISAGGDDGERGAPVVRQQVEIGGHPTWVDARGSGDETVLLLHGGMSNSHLLPTGSGSRGRAVPDRRIRSARARLHGGHARSIPLRGHGARNDRRARSRRRWSSASSRLERRRQRRPTRGMRRPDIVDRMAVIGANFHHDGVLPLELGEDSRCCPDLRGLRGPLA